MGRINKVAGFKFDRRGMVAAILAGLALAGLRFRQRKPPAGTR